MRSRMERYETSSFDKNSRRSNKNKELYQNIGNNTKYTNFTDVEHANAFDIETAQKNYRTREGYHKMKDYNSFMKEPEVKKELDDFNFLYQNHENRIYDINSVLAEAKKNRIEKDELEEKRKLKDTNYNILASLNPKELEKYKKEKVERGISSDEELRELIDTITTKTLIGEIDHETSVDLLSDLMATNKLDCVEKPKKESINSEKQKEINNEDSLYLSKEVLDKEEIKMVQQLKDQKSSLDGSDTDFYTRSMDLSDKDFEMDDEFKEKKLPIFVKIIFIFLVIIILAISGYYIYKTFL